MPRPSAWLAIALAAAAAGALHTAGCGGGSSPGSTVADVAKPRPVFLLGFDGLDPRLVEEWEGEGALPNFARLRSEGAVGRIRSTIPYISPPAWTTVATGVPPGDHGVWSFWIPEDENPRGRYVDATCRLAPTIWEDLSDLGRTVGIVNVPVTSPPDRVNGFFIAGFPYPRGAPLTWPAELEADVRARGYLPDEYGGAPIPGREEEWLDHVEAIARGRREVGLDLLFERSPDLSFIVFTSPDRIQHHLWKFHDEKHPLHDAAAPERLRTAVRDSYVWCDDVLREVRERLPDESILFVLSDHGFGPAYLGISKARVLADLDAAGEAPVTRNLFGGDFWLGGADVDRRADVARRLESLRAPDGTPLVRAVHDTRAKPVRGYGLELGPEIVAEETDGFLFVPGRGASDPLVGRMPPRSFSAYHRRLGYFAAAGPPVVPGPVRDSDLRDVPAMAMHILGEKIPRRYVNNLPRKLFPPTYFVERPMRYVGAATDGLRRPGSHDPTAPEAGVEEQLRALGYVQ